MGCRGCEEGLMSLRFAENERALEIINFLGNPMAIVGCEMHRNQLKRMLVLGEEPWQEERKELKESGQDPDQPQGTLVLAPGEGEEIENPEEAEAEEEKTPTPSESSGTPLPRIPPPLKQRSIESQSTRDLPELA
jgi:hypothetical protein